MVSLVAALKGELPPIADRVLSARQAVPDGAGAGLSFGLAPLVSPRILTLAAGCGPGAKSRDKEGRKTRQLFNNNNT